MFISTVLCCTVLYYTCLLTYYIFNLWNPFRHIKNYLHAHIIIFDWLIKANCYVYLQDFHNVFHLVNWSNTHVWGHFLEELLQCFIYYVIKHFPWHMGGMPQGSGYLVYFYLVEIQNTTFWHYFPNMFTILTVSQTILTNKNILRPFWQIKTF